MSCGTEVITPDPNEHSCSPVGFKKNKTPLGNNEMEVVVYCYTGGNHIRAIIPAGVFTLSKKETQAEVDAACRAFYEAALRLELDCDQPQFYSFNDSAELGVLPKFVGAYVGGTWFSFPYPESGQANELPAMTVGLNEPFYLPNNQNCLMGDPPPDPILYYCPANTPSLTPLFDTRPPNWATRGSFSTEIPLLENYDYHPVFGNFNATLHSFFQGASTLPTLDPDEAFNQPWAAREPLDGASGDLRIGYTGVGPELFSGSYTTVLGYNDVLPRGYVSVCQGHDGDLYIAVQDDYRQIKLKSALMGTFNWAGESPRVFTSRVFTGRQSTSETYCIYLNLDVSETKIFARKSSDGFSTEIEVVDFPVPLRYLQDVARVGDRLVLWAMTKGQYRRDIHQVVMFSDPWVDESIKREPASHSVEVISGALEQSVFSPEDAIRDGGSHSVGVVTGKVRDAGQELEFDYGSHSVSVISGMFEGDLAPLPVIAEGSAHSVAVRSGYRFQSNAVTADKASHNVGVVEGQLA